MFACHASFACDLLSNTSSFRYSEIKISIRLIVKVLLNSRAGQRLVSDIPAGDGKNYNLFYSVSIRNWYSTISLSLEPRLIRPPD
jgi:hypothetical protein